MSIKRKILAYLQLYFVEGNYLKSRQLHCHPITAYGQGG